MNRLSFQYFFSPLPDPNFQYSKLTLIVCLLLLAAGGALYFYRKKKVKDEILRRMLRPYPQMLLIYGFLALFLLFCRETTLPYLSMRFWWIVLFAGLLYSTLKFAITFKARYAALQGKREKTNVQNKYLPKKKS